MSAVAKKKLTEAEYLAIERAAEQRSEFYNGEMFAMASAKYPHNRIKDNLAGEIYSQLTGGPCFPLSSDMRVKSIETLKEIVLVSQDEPVIERFVRQSADSWEFTNTAGLENEFAFGTVPVRAAMAAIYAGVTFPEPSGP